MSDDESTELSGCSDAELMAEARAGGHAPLAELWRRHHRAGVQAARRCTASLDPDDLVSEAFTRIIRAMRAGGGPRDAFRPYLYATIRNVAARWASTDRTVTTDDWSLLDDPEVGEDPAVRALERTLTARAFRSLPDRWQSVLWYTEVEGLDPHEVAPLLGLSPNAVAALAYRAREALRTAWLQAHVADSRTPPDCAWSVSRLGEHARDQLSPTNRRRMLAHLQQCTRCSILAEEIDDLASHAALVLVPLMLGATAAGAAPTQSGASSATLASMAPVPALPVVPALPAVMAASSAAASSGAFSVLAPVLVAAVVMLGAASSVSGAVPATRTPDAGSTSTDSGGVDPSAPPGGPHAVAEGEPGLAGTPGAVVAVAESTLGATTSATAGVIDAVAGDGVVGLDPGTPSTATDGDSVSTDGLIADVETEALDIVDNPVASIPPLLGAPLG